MSYAIIGFGAVGQALAHAFARRDIEVAVAGRRPAEALASQARAIGRTVVPKALGDAIKADTIILAVPFGSHQEVGKAQARWDGKTIIDAMNAFGVPPAELDGLPSSAAVARAFPGGRLVKGFNHLAAGVLRGDPAIGDLRRVVFLSSDDAGGAATVAALAERLGFAPVELGRLAEGGALVQARGSTWAPLIFQDLFKRQV